MVDREELRHDPILAVLAGKLTARRKDRAPAAGKSTLNRLEPGGATITPYRSRRRAGRPLGTVVRSGRGISVDVSSGSPAILRTAALSHIGKIVPAGRVL
jgi:hypothetical protein